MIGSYAYTDAEVTEDIDISVGNKLLGVPENQANLWTTYEIQKGDLKGLGFGLGLFYVGERAALSDNSVELPNYLRTDAAIFYRRDRFNAAINIRNLFDTDYFSSTYGYTLGLERGAPLTIIGYYSLGALTRCCVGNRLNNVLQSLKGLGLALELFDRRASSQACTSAILVKSNSASLKSSRTGKGRLLRGLK